MARARGRDRGSMSGWPFEENRLSGLEAGRGALGSEEVTFTQKQKCLMHNGARLQIRIRIIKKKK